jgi:hypothetical protein
VRFSTCSWCHTLNEQTSLWCQKCGHAAHLARSDCNCPKCLGLFYGYDLLHRALPGLDHEHPVAGGSEIPCGGFTADPPAAIDTTPKTKPRKRR